MHIVLVCSCCYKGKPQATWFKEQNFISPNSVDWVVKDEGADWFHSWIKERKSCINLGNKSRLPTKEQNQIHPQFPSITLKVRSWWNMYVELRGKIWVFSQKLLPRVKLLFMSIESESMPSSYLFWKIIQSIENFIEFRS